MTCVLTCHFVALYIYIYISNQYFHLNICNCMYKTPFGKSSKCDKFIKSCIVCKLLLQRISALTGGIVIEASYTSQCVLCLSALHCDITITCVPLLFDVSF